MRLSVIRVAPRMPVAGRVSMAGEVVVAAGGTALSVTEVTFGTFSQS